MLPASTCSRPFNLTKEIQPMLDIYSVLISKSSKLHYIKRYIKFINDCSAANCSLNENIYTELHHICPKAADLFPEYTNLNQYPENSVYLTYRQHLIAHIMLWKIFGKSQATALKYMLCTKKRIQRVIPPAIKLRYLETVRLEDNENKKGNSVYKDDKNKNYYLHKENPIITEFKLVGVNTGSIQTEQNKKAISAKLSGTANYMYPETKEFFGRLSTNNPIIVELGLVPLITDNHKKQWQERSKKAHESLLGTNIYNNGTVEARFREDPGGEWVLGRIPRSENYKQNFLDGIRAKNSGTLYWNDGTICRKFPKEQHPGDGWVRGRLPKSSKTISVK